MVRPCPGTGVPAGPARQHRSPPPHIKRGFLLRLFTPLKSLKCAARRIGPGVHIPGGRGTRGARIRSIPRWGAAQRTFFHSAGVGGGVLRSALFWSRPGRAHEAGWLSPRGDTEQGGPGSSRWWRPADPGTTLLQPTRLGDAWTGRTQIRPSSACPRGSERQAPPAPSGRRLE